MLQDISGLRIIGLIIGIIGLFLTFLVYRGPKWKRFNFVFFGIFSISIILISIDPDLINNLADLFSLNQESRGRLLFLLISSNIVLWMLFLYFKTKLDEQDYRFDLLVRNVSQEGVEEKIEKEIKDREIMVLIPAFNEAQNLKELLKKIPGEIAGKKVGVLVVDDGSTDETANVVRDAGYSVVKNKINRGGGAALRLGYDILNNSQAKICVTMDADGQHNPEEIERLVKPILENKYDFVIGSRILGRWEADNKIRYMGVHFFNFTINLLLGTKITDCASGFRAFKTGLLKSVVLKEDQYHTSELIIDAVKKNLRVGEAPITISKRKHGKTKKGNILMYGLNFAKTILKTWWR